MILFWLGVISAFPTPRCLQVLSTPCHGATDTFPGSELFCTTDKICATVPLTPHNLQRGSSLFSHLCKLTGVGSVSYTALIKNDIWKGSNRHNSVHVMVLLVRSHLVHAPWVQNSMDLALRYFSSWFQTSSWIQVLFSLEVDFNHCWKWDVPMPCLPMQGLPMRCLENNNSDPHTVTSKKVKGYLLK